MGAVISYLLSSKQPSGSRQLNDYKVQQLEHELQVKDSTILTLEQYNQDLDKTVDRIQAERDSAKLETRNTLDQITKLKARYEKSKKYDFSAGVTGDSIARAFAAELSH